jgi:AAA domain
LNAEMPTLNLIECAQFIQFWTDVTDVPHVTLIAIIPDGDISARTFACGDEHVGEWIEARQKAGCNVYFQPNETKPDCRGKPSKEQMVTALCRFADIDPNDEHFPLTDERVRLSRLAMHLVSDPDFPPTVIIDSGNGVQAIWVVEREVLLSSVITRIEGETKAIEEAVGAGGTHNIDRLLRLPGTVNIPNKKKLRVGRGRSRARLIHAGANVCTPAQAATLAGHLKASLNGTDLVRPKPTKASKGPVEDPIDNEIDALIEQLRAANAEKISRLADLPTPLQTRLKTALKARGRLADRWAGMIDDLTERGLDDSRSGADFSLAAMLKAAGFSHFETALILCAFQHGKVNGDGWPNVDAGLRYVARCVLRSYDPKARTERTEPAGHDFADVSGFRLDIMTAGTPPPRRFLLEPLMPLGTVGLVIGPGGVGKSLTLFDLCIQVATPVSLGNGSRDHTLGPLGGVIPADARGASVFLTLEDDRAEIHRRAVALDRGNTRSGLPCYVIPGLDLPDFDPVLVTAEGRAAALTEFAETGLDNLLCNIAAAARGPVRLLVLDPAGDFLDVDENDATYVKLFMRRLRVMAVRHGCTIILLGHVAKEVDVDGPSMRGSSAWVANSRFAYALWRPPGVEAQKQARKLKVTVDQLVLGNLIKANHAGAPIGQKRHFVRDTETGRLIDLTARASPGSGLSDDELLTMLVNACAEYAAAGMPFAYSGVAGLWNGQADLPEQLSQIPKKRLEQLGTLALESGRLVKARTTHTQGAPKYLDLPNGPLARGLEIEMPFGSRREALANRAAAQADAVGNGNLDLPDGEGPDAAGDAEPGTTDKCDAG